MFTISDICDIAVQIERNGEDAYRQAARIASNSKSAETLNWMADEEQGHARWFENIAIKQADQRDLQEMKMMGRALLQEMVKDQTFDLKSTSIATAGDMKALIAQSIEFERDTITFYEMLSDFVEDDSVRSQLDLIIKEERGHILSLEHLKA